MMPFEFHFLRPWWLLMLFPLAALLWNLLHTDGDAEARAWRGVVDPHLLPRLLSGENTAAARLPLVLLGTGWFVLVVALAGPTWQRLPQAVYQAQQFRVIALDLSPSMHATDIKPSRLTHARYEVLDLLRSAGDGQTALIAYGAEPFVVSPLTGDADTIAAQVPLLDTGLLPTMGARRTDLAIALAGDLLRQAGARDGNVILVTDDLAQPGKAVEAARSLAAEGFHVSVLGVGTSKGAPVSLADGGLLKDSSGAIVVPQLDADRLRGLAAAGQGHYATAGFGDRDIEALLSVGSAQLGDDAAKQDATTEQWREEGPWLLLFLLPLAAVAFRRGWIGSVPILLVCLLPTPDAYAGPWDDMWLRADQQAMRELEAGRPDRAVPMFERSDWRAAAAYRSGDFATALESLEGDATNAYNRGNTLARLGRLEDAVAAYDEALRGDPGDADAMHNRELVRRLLQRRQRQQDNENEQSDRSSDQNQQNDQGAQNEDDQQAAESDQGEQNEQDQQGGESDQGEQERSAQTAQQSDSGKPQPGEEDQGGSSVDEDVQQPGAQGQSADQGSQAADKAQNAGGREKEIAEREKQGSQQDDEQTGTNRRHDDNAEPAGGQQSTDSEQQADRQNENAERQHSGDAEQQAEQGDQTGESTQQGQRPDSQQEDSDAPADAGDRQGEQVEQADGQGSAPGKTDPAHAPASMDGPPEKPGTQDEDPDGESGDKPGHDELARGGNNAAKQGGRPQTKAEETGRPGLDDLLGGDDSRRQPSKKDTQMVGTTNEDAQALEQMLRQVEDDPGGLLRQRFLLQYLRRKGQLP